MKLLLLQELEAQPESYLEQIVSSFEITSIHVVTGRDEVRAYKSRPAFSSTLVLIFKSLEVYKSNQPFIKYDWMWPILVCRTASSLATAKAYCMSKEIDMQVSIHSFEKEDADKMIRSLAKKPVSQAFVDAVIRQVTLSPQRILSAMAICDAVGYTASAVRKYVDKYTHTSTHDVIRLLLGLSGKRQTARAMLQVEQAVNWYRWFKKQVLAELSTIEEVFVDALAGEVSDQNLLAYLEAKGLTHYEVLFCLDLFYQVSLVEIRLLKERVRLARNALEILAIMQ